MGLEWQLSKRAIPSGQLHYHKTATALQILTDFVSIEPGYSFSNSNGWVDAKPF